MVDAGVNCKASIPVDAELTDDFLLVMLGSRVVGPDVSIVTTFTPIAPPADDGMNKDVTFFFLRMVLSGWKLAQHEAFVSPVEYSWRASPRLFCRSITSL